MTYAGPSIIGNNDMFAGIQPFLVTNGYVQVYGPNNVGKVTVADSNGLYLLQLDTVNHQIDIGGTILPLTAGIYDLGSSARHFRNLYADNVHISTLNPSLPVQTDSAGSLITSSTFAQNLTYTGNALHMGTSSTKLLIQDGGGTQIFKVDTGTPATSTRGQFFAQTTGGATVFQVVGTSILLPQIGGGILQAGASPPYLMSASNTLAQNITFTGDTQFVGSSSSKIQAIDGSSNVVFSVDTATPAVAVRSTFNVTTSGGTNALNVDSSGNLQISSLGAGQIVQTSPTFPFSLIGSTNLPNSTSGTSCLWTNPQLSGTVQFSSLTGNTVLQLNGGSVAVGSNALPAITSTGSTFTNTTLSGTTTVGGAVNLSATLTIASTSAGVDFQGLQVYNNSQTATSTSSIGFKAGDTGVSVTDYIGLSTVGAASTITIGNSALRIQGANSNNKLLIVDTIGTSIFSVDTSTPIVNLLNGTSLTMSGNFTQTGSGLFSTGTGAVSINGNSVSVGTVTIDSTNNANKFRIQNFATTTVFNVNTTTSAVTTVSNTLDDGAGTLTAGVLVASGSSSSNLSNGVLKNTGTGGVVLTFLSASATKTGTFTFNNAGLLTGSATKILFAPASTDTTSFFQIQSASAVVMLSLDSTTGALFSYKNTLDDGSGAMTIIGNISQTGATTFSTGTGATTLNGNVTISGSNTFKTGTGNVTISGNTTCTGNFTTTSAQVSFGNSTIVKTAGGMTWGSGTTSWGGNCTNTQTSAGAVISMLTLKNAGTTAGTGSQIVFQGSDGAGVKTLTIAWNDTVCTLNPNSGSGDFNFAGNIWPFYDSTYSCGKSGNKWSAIWANNGTIQTSDARQKNSIAPADLGLSFINQLKPVSYIMNVDHNVVADDGTLTPVAGTATCYGMLAQDLHELLPTIGKTLDTFGALHYDEVTDEYGIRYTEFIAPLVLAVQQVSANIKALRDGLAILGYDVPLPY